VIRHRLRSARVDDEWRRWDVELTRQLLHQRLDPSLHLRQSHARVAKTGELNGKADPVGIPTPCRQEFQSGALEGEASHHAIGIEWNAEKGRVLFPGQQLSVRHRCSSLRGRRAYRHRCPSNDH
jgi:hypothetical protein